MTLKVRILPYLTTFAQLSARLKKLVIGFGPKGRLGKMCNCATVWVKSVVILMNVKWSLKLIWHTLLGTYISQRKDKTGYLSWT